MATYPQYFQLGQNLPKTVGGPLPIGTPDYIIKMLEAAGVQPAPAYSQARPVPMPVVRAAEAIRSIESSNNYRALGPTIDDPNSMYYGDRAYGAYQVMGKNIGPWTREVLGKEMTPEEFLADRAAQDKVFQAKFGQSFYKHGNLEDAASTWFTGQPLSRGAGRSDTLGTTGSEYVDRFLKALPSEEGDPMDIRNMAALQPAQPQPAQPQQSRMAGLLSDPALLENLALAFNTLRMTPDENLATVIRGRQERRADIATRNRTIEILRQRGLKDLADAVESGAIDARTAAAELLRRPERVTPMSTIGKLADDLNAGRITQEQYDLAVANMAPQGMTIEATPGGGFRLVQGAGAAAKPLTEGQSKDVVYATRAEGALNVLEGMTPEGQPISQTLTSAGQRAANIDPTGLIRGAVQTPEFQVAQQAGQEFLQAILRKDTGAAITSQEQQLYGETFLPQPGDSPEVLAAKVQSRRRAIEAIKAGLPPSAIVAQERALQRDLESGKDAESVAAPSAAQTPDFSKMTDAELDAYIAEQGRIINQRRGQ